MYILKARLRIVGRLLEMLVITLLRSAVLLEIYILHHNDKSLLPEALDPMDLNDLEL